MGGATDMHWQQFVTQQMHDMYNRANLTQNASKQWWCILSIKKGSVEPQHTEETGEHYLLQTI